MYCSFSEGVGKACFRGLLAALEGMSTSLQEGNGGREEDEKGAVCGQLFLSLSCIILSHLVV